MRAAIDLPALIDELGKVRDLQAKLVTREDDIKEKLAHLRSGAFAGKRYTLVIAETEREVLDQDAARKALGVAWVKANTRTVPIRSLYTNRMGKIATRNNRRAGG